MADCGTAHGRVEERLDGLEEKTITLFTKADQFIRDLSCKVGFTLFLWLLGGVALSLMALVGYVHGVDKDVGQGAACIKVLEAQVGQVVKTVDRIDRKIDRMNGFARDKKPDD